MSAWGHYFEALSERLKQYGCAYCKGSWYTKPRAVVGLRYHYVAGHSGRTTSGVRGICLEHATKAAKKHGITLPEEL